MLNIKGKHPTHLWEQLAEEVLSPGRWAEYRDDRRQVSYGNVLEVQRWPATYTADALFWAVGYELYGNKMTRLMNHYLDETQWDPFWKEWAERRKSKRPFTIGMHFKRNVVGAGGCLGSVEIAMHEGKPILFLHSKTAEFPKKFTADMKLISWIMTELQIKEARVIWYLSSIWTTLHAMKGIQLVLGRNKMDALLGERLASKLWKIHPGYLEPTQVRIHKHHKELSESEHWQGILIDPERGHRVETGA